MPFRNEFWKICGILVCFANISTMKLFLAMKSNYSFAAIFTFYQYLQSTIFVNFFAYYKERSSNKGIMSIIDTKS